MSLSRTCWFPVCLKEKGPKLTFGPHLSCVCMVEARSQAELSRQEGWEMHFTFEPSARSSRGLGTWDFPGYSDSVVAFFFFIFIGLNNFVFISALPTPSAPDLEVSLSSWILLVVNFPS